MLFSKQNGRNKQLHHIAFATLQGGYKTVLEIPETTDLRQKLSFKLSIPHVPLNLMNIGNRIMKGTNRVQIPGRK